MSGHVVACPKCENDFVYPPNSPQAECPCCYSVIDNPFPFGDPTKMNLIGDDTQELAHYDQRAHIAARARPPPVVYMKLDTLEKFENILVSQKHVCWCCKMLCCDNNVYFVSTLEDRGDALMVLEEQSDCCSKCCCGPVRGMGLDMTAGHLPGGNMLARYERPFRLPAGAFCCTQEMRSYAKGKIAGHSEIPCYLCKPEVLVYDNRGRVGWNIKGPCCLCGNPRFEIRRGANQTGEVIGFIQKEWGGASKECCTDSDSFSMMFPRQANVENRVNLIGALVLIDLNYFEGRANSPFSS
jgi:hypothetical protein